MKRKNYLSRRDSLKKEGLYQKKELHSTGTCFTKKDFDEFGRAGLERVQAGKKNWDLWSVLEARERERVGLKRKSCMKRKSFMKKEFH